MYPWQQIHTQWGVSTWFVLRSDKQGIKSVVRQFCMGDCEYRTWVRDAEESPLLEVIARQQLVKTRQARKRLAGAVVIYELWRLVVVL
jgi:hypothetical protein